MWQWTVRVKMNRTFPKTWTVCESRRSTPLKVTIHCQWPSTLTRISCPSIGLTVHFSLTLFQIAFFFFSENFSLEGRSFLWPCTYMTVYLYDRAHSCFWLVNLDLFQNEIGKRIMDGEKIMKVFVNRNIYQICNKDYVKDRYVWLTLRLSSTTSEQKNDALLYVAPCNLFLSWITWNM